MKIENIDKAVELRRELYMAHKCLEDITNQPLSIFKTFAVYQSRGDSIGQPRQLEGEENMLVLEVKTQIEKYLTYRENAIKAAIKALD